jgi:hypothetical protein
MKNDTDTESETKEAQWLGGVRRLASSSKAIVVAVAVAGVILMNVTGRIDGKNALDFIMWIVAAFIGATALEDAAEKRAGGAPARPVPVEKLIDFVTRTMSIIQGARPATKEPATPPGPSAVWPQDVDPLPDPDASKPPKT